MSGASGSTSQLHDGGSSWIGRLRQERERHGLDRQQVAEDLHVDEQTIAALEDGHFESFSAPVFARGHLRKYAALLGLDADEVVAAFDQERARPPELVPLTASAPLRPGLPVKWLGAATVAAMVLGVGWWALTQQEPPIEQREPLAKQRAQEAPSEAKVVAEPVAPAPEPRAAGQAASDVSAQGTPVRLTLSFSEDSWVELYDAGGRRLFFDLGSANSVRTLTGAAPLKVFLGFADGVQLELNGQPLAVPAEVRRGNVARFTVDEHGQVRRPEG